MDYPQNLTASDRYWYDLIQKCRTSGKSDYQWLKDNNIKSPTFYYHVKQLRKKHANCLKLRKEPPYRKSRKLFLFSSKMKSFLLQLLHQKLQFRRLQIMLLLSVSRFVASVWRSQTQHRRPLYKIPYLRCETYVRRYLRNLQNLLRNRRHRHAPEF